MRKIGNDKEYINIVKDILVNSNFRELQNCVHHGDNRMFHCVRVSYYSYLIAKHFGLRYKEMARAGLLHDFFLDRYEDMTGFDKFKLLFTHSKIALKNSKKYFKLTELEENVIASHMFPVGLILPRHKEAWILDLVDDYFCLYERFHSTINMVKNGINKLFDKEPVPNEND